MTTVDLSVPVHLVKGDDEVVLRDGARELVHTLAEGLDAGLAVEEVGAEQFSPADGDTSIRPLVDAAQTPPFLTDRRVVVGRGVEMFTKADQVAPLVAYLDDPLPTTNLVLVWAGGRIPKSLAEAVKRPAARPSRRAPAARWRPGSTSRSRASALKLDKAAVARLVDWLGDDPQKLVGLLDDAHGLLRPRHQAHDQRRRAVPRRGRRRPPVGADRRHRQGRHARWPSTGCTG